MKNRITFEVDTVKLFDVVAAFGRGQPLGDRLVSALLGTDQDMGFSEVLGLAFYGITVAATERGIENAPENP